MERKPKRLQTNQTFNNQEWRTLLNETCQAIDTEKVGLTVISPWGFEVTNDKIFLSKQLRRFYCYIGIPKVSTKKPDEVANAFTNELFKRLKAYPEFYQQVVIKIVQEHLYKLKPNDYHCLTTDKLIDIQARVVKNNILDDYADYLVATLDSVANAKGECKNYQTNKMWRARAYQLYIMEEFLYGDLLMSMNDRQIQLMDAVYSRIDNQINQFYYDQEMHVGLEKEEATIFNELIFPRMKQAIEKVEKADDLVTVKIDAYHHSDDLVININADIYQQVHDKVTKSYLNFI